MVENVIQESLIFDLTGGLLCLDFANTLDNRTDVHPQELLNSYNDLVLWSQQADVLTEKEARRLLEKAEQHSSEATRVLKRAVEVREAIFRIFKAVAEDESPEDEDLDRRRRWRRLWLDDRYHRHDEDRYFAEAIHLPIRSASQGLRKQ